MCKNLTVLMRNEYKQVIFICEHDTLHITHKHITVVLTREAFFQLDSLFHSSCLLNSGSLVRCKVTDDGYVELWIGQGAFRMTADEMTALAKLVAHSADILRNTPLNALLKPVQSTGWSVGPHVNFSLN